LSALLVPLTVRSALGALVIAAATFATAPPAAAVESTGFHSARAVRGHGPSNEHPLRQPYGRLCSVVFGADGALCLTTSNGTGDRILRSAATQP